MPGEESDGVGDSSEAHNYGCLEGYTISETFEEYRSQELSTLGFCCRCQLFNLYIFLEMIKHDVSKFQFVKACKTDGIQWLMTLIFEDIYQSLTVPNNSTDFSLEYVTPAS